MQTLVRREVEGTQVTTDSRQQTADRRQQTKDSRHTHNVPAKLSLASPQSRERRMQGTRSYREQRRASECRLWGENVEERGYKERRQERRV
jgi:hypothetical protein